MMLSDHISGCIIKCSSLKLLFYEFNDFFPSHVFSTTHKNTRTDEWIMSNVLLLIFDLLVLPVTVVRMFLIYLYGSRYGINELSFLDVMLHARNSYFNQLSGSFDVVGELEDEDVRVRINKCSLLNREDFMIDVEKMKEVNDDDSYDHDHDHDHDHNHDNNVDLTCFIKNTNPENIGDLHNKESQKREQEESQMETPLGDTQEGRTVLPEENQEQRQSEREQEFPLADMPISEEERSNTTLLYREGINNNYIKRHEDSNDDNIQRNDVSIYDKLIDEQIDMFSFVMKQEDL